VRGAKSPTAWSPTERPRGDRPLGGGSAAPRCTRRPASSGSTGQRDRALPAGESSSTGSTSPVALATHRNKHHPSGCTASTWSPRFRTYASAIARPNAARVDGDLPACSRHATHLGPGNGRFGGAGSPPHVQCCALEHAEHVNSAGSSRGARPLHVVHVTVGLAWHTSAGDSPRMACASSRVTSAPSTRPAARCAVSSSPLCVRWCWTILLRFWNRLSHTGHWWGCSYELLCLVLKCFRSESLVLGSAGTRPGPCPRASGRACASPPRSETP
jgi:hypothetical protein